MRRSLTALALPLLVVAAACGGSEGASDAGEDGSSSPASPLPAECVSAPFTVAAGRTGEEPAGSDSYEVASAVALPVRLEVPGGDMFMYVMFFGDEQFDASDVGTFAGYGPEAAGRSRGTIVLSPAEPGSPIATGSVLTPGDTSALGLDTTLFTIGMDFKTAPDEINGYQDTIQGSVTVLALTDDAMCIDADLSWTWSGMSTTKRGELRIRGVFTAPLAPVASIPLS